MVVVHLNAFDFLTGGDKHYLQYREWDSKDDSARHTCVWVHREVRVSLADAVDQFGTAPVHTIVSICSCHLDHRCT